ncbi:YqjF family protein [soil metagenome]
MSQWWRDIAFVHWRVDPALVAPLLPAGVRPDLYDGSAWVGLIPFRMVDAGIGHGRGVPHFGTFLETNVRLYSTDDQGRHGVVFCSLEAERLSVVAAANAGLGVPYKWARMSFTETLDETSDQPFDLEAPAARRIRYATTRRTGARPRSEMDVEVGEPVVDPSQLDLFLTARFGLHTRVLGQTVWIPNTHGPWPLHRARVVSVRDELVAAAGLGATASAEPDSVLFSPGVRTVFGLPQRL